MALFRRRPDERPTGPDVAQLMVQGTDAIEQTAKAHAERWGLGSAEAWNIDQESGLIRWTFGERTVEASVQVLGSYGAGGTWLWAWANESLLPSIRSTIEAVREFGHQHELAMLTTPELAVSEEQAADLAALAFRIAEATGFYRAPAGPSQLYVTFGAVKITSGDGRVESFAINFD